MLTKKQKNFLEKIKSLNRRNGVFPTVREIARATGLSSPATIHAYLGRLQARGALRKEGRAWELAGDPSGAMRPEDRRLAVPLVGMVPAGPALEIF